MGKPSLNPDMAVDDFGQALSVVRRYLQQHAVSKSASAFARLTSRGVYMEVGGSPFLLRPLSDNSDYKEATKNSGLYSFAELRALGVDRPDPVIEGLIFRGETVLIAGRPKVGKSRLAHQMALQSREPTTS